MYIKLHKNDFTRKNWTLVSQFNIEKLSLIRFKFCDRVATLLETESGISRLFLKMGQPRPLLGYFTPFHNAMTNLVYKVKLNWKSVDVLLGFELGAAGWNDCSSRRIWPLDHQREVPRCTYLRQFWIKLSSLVKAFVLPQTLKGFEMWRQWEEKDVATKILFIFLEAF